MYKAGLKPPRPNSVKMLFGTYFKADKLPAVPTKFGRPWLVKNSWGMLGNDVEGDCFWAGAAHETMMLHADSHIGIPMFTTNTVLHDYHAATGGGDSGTDMQEGYAWRQKIGIHDQLGGVHKIDIYTALRAKDERELELAVSILGVAGIGVKLPDNAESQFNYHEPWAVEPGAHVIAYHYVPVIGRNSLGDWLIVTWGRIQAMTPEWFEEYNDEGIAFLSRDRLNTSGLSPQGLDLAALEDDYHQLTGA